MIRKSIFEVEVGDLLCFLPTLEFGRIQSVDGGHFNVDWDDSFSMSCDMARVSLIYNDSMVAFNEEKDKLILELKYA